MSLNPPREPGTQPDPASAHLQSAQGAQGAQGTLLADDQIRWLRRAVVGMTAVLVAGVVLLIGRVIYLARPSGTQAASAGAPMALLPEVRLALPARVVIKSMTASGSRVYVVHAPPAGDDELTVVDLATGKIVSHMAIERGK